MTNKHYILIFLISSICVWYGAAFLGQQSIKGSFLELFVNDSVNDSVNLVGKGKAKQYIEACCKDRDSVIAMLKENGFEVVIYSSPEKVASLNRHWNSQIEYDEFISAVSGPPFWQFWDIFCKYEVFLFIENGKIDRVRASVDRTMP